MAEMAEMAEMANVVVPPLDAPGGYGGVVHGAAQREVGLHVPLQVVEHRAMAPESPHQCRVIVDVVQDREPVAGRRLRIGAVSPEFGQHPGIVGARNPLRRIRLAGARVQLVSLAGITAFEQVVKGRIGLHTARQLRDVADRRR